MLVAVIASAHPEKSAQIEAITARIQKEPENAELYLHRADLHRQESQFELAMSDLATAARLKHDWPQLSLVRGQIQFDEGDWEKALRSVERFLSSETNHAPGLLLRARCQRQLGRHDLAVADYNLALKFFAQPNPDVYVERARIEAALGHFESAIAGLDEGIQRLGSLPGLESMAIQLERQSGQFDAAVRRIEEMEKMGAGGPAELLLKADVLEQAGRLDSARNVINQVIRAVAVLPRPTMASAGLEADAKRGLERIERKLSQK